MTVTGAASPIGAHETVVIADGLGVAFVPADAPLIGLNYFDGRFLRADDLNLERRGQRTYAELSNRARGTGVVAGFDLTERDGATLSLSAGLAVDPQGRVLHMPVAVSVAVRDLLDTSRVPVAGATAPAVSSAAAFAPCESAVATPAATSTVDDSSRFLVCLAHATGLCGQAEVLGRLCDGGCTTAADRPYVVDGVRLLLRPLDLTLDPSTIAPGVTSEAQLRSRVAAAYFAKEFADAGPPLSRAGLESAVWSAGAPLSGGDVVPIGVLGWNGSTMTFLDTWTARRELIDPAPSRYWAGQVEQRPWSVFLAQVLQFQSHLTAQPPPVPSPALPPRILLERGLVELPPAGYLTVDPDEPDLRGQVQDLMGPGVALRLCAVPRDQIPRELERAQHLERISLLRAVQGRPPEEVDVLVPDGSVVAVPAGRTGFGFGVDATVGEPPLDGSAQAVPLIGAARTGDGPGVELRLAVGATGSALTPLIVGLVNTILDPTTIGPELTGRRPRPTGPDVGLLRVFAEAAVRQSVLRRARASTARATSAVAGQGVALWVAVSIDDDPFTLAEGTETAADLSLDLSVAGSDNPKLTARLRGFLKRMPGGSRNPAREIVVDIDGLVDLTVTNPSNLKVPETGQYPGHLRLTLHRGTVEGASTFAVTNEKETLAAAVAWTGSPTVVQGAVSVLGGDGSGLQDLLLALVGAPAGLLARLAALESWATPIAVVAREDPTVGTPGRQHHDGAEAALILLAASPGADPRDAGQRYRQLFPPDADTLTSEVRPSIDWVLFRRRTRKDCEGGPPVGPPESAPVTVWIRTEDSEDQADQVVGAIQEGQWPDDGWHRADVVFEPAASVLLTPAETWRSRYRDALGGPHIALAAYAGTPTESAAIVGPGRLDALLAATPPAGVRDLDASVGVAVDPPPGRILPATVGSVFLVTYKDVEVPEPVLAVVAVGKEAEDAVRTAINEGDAAVVAKALTSLVRPGEVTPQDQDLSPVVDELRVAFPTVPADSTAVLWIEPELPSAVRDALVALAERMARAAEPVMGLPGTAVPPPVEVVPPAGLPAATLFFIVTVLN